MWDTHLPRASWTWLPSQKRLPEEPADEPDHVGVQLDALAGMVDRQGQSLSPAAETAPEAPVASRLSPTRTATTAEEPAVDSPSRQTRPVPGPTEQTWRQPRRRSTRLTAPLAALTEAGAPPASAEAAPPRSWHRRRACARAGAPPGCARAARRCPSRRRRRRVRPRRRATSGPPDAQRQSCAPLSCCIVATAVLNLILVGLNAVLGAPTGSMAMVVLGVALITLAAWTGAAVTFLHWVSRAHAHVAATAASRQRHGESMSLIGWFIPIAGFVIGYRVLQDLWTGSDPTTRDQADAAPAKARSIDIWLLGIVTAALFGYVMPLALGESALWGGLSALGLMVAALSLASTMGAISAWQVETGRASAER